jgi:hypothetical protein
MSFAGKTPLSRGTGTRRLVELPPELEIVDVGKPQTMSILLLNALSGPSDGCKW